MGIKQTLLKPFAKKVSRDIQKWAAHPIEAQEKQFQALIQGAKHTKFGKDHGFSSIRNHADFAKQVPIRDYEGLKDYITLIRQGQRDVLWKGMPKYFAKTSGTTSGAKYIPLSKESIPNHFGTARNALFHIIAQTGKGDFIDGKMIFLSGSPELKKVDGVLTGRLSGIVNHQVPSWLKTSQVPSWETNCIEEWEEKLDRIVEETYNKDMRMISGIPPWVQMYYERLLEKTGKSTVKEVFPNYSMFVYGGVNFEPYRAKLESLIGESIPSVETYPASEGFIAFQDLPTNEGLLLNVNSGIFFEFIPAGEIFDENPTRLSLRDVELGVNYAIIINNNAGLWGYNIGDTVEFVSKAPYRIRVTGRIKHYISAFGEHVIGKEVEQAMLQASSATGLSIVEFTVAPNVNPSEGLPYHEWFVAMDEIPSNLAAFSKQLDAEMVKQNIYYEDLIVGNILRPLVVTPVRKDAFREYMREVGRLGGQNKVPRLSNDRKIASILEKFKL